MLTLRCSDCSDDDGFDEAIETAVCANITGLTNQSSQSFTYQYDGLERLTTSDQTSTTPIEYSFTYDSTGNRTSKKVGAAATQAYNYLQVTDPNPNHQLQSVAGVVRTYDANGNTTKSASNKFFTYDQRNRMVDFRTGSASSTIVSQYQYNNAKGERVRKYKGTVDQARYVFNDAGQLMVEETISGTTTTTTDIIWLDGIPVDAVRGGTLYAIEADHLGTPRNLYDFATKTKIWSWPLGADAFGETAPNQDPDANGTAFVFNMRFPGQLFDAESGLHQNYFRDYEAATGRYPQSDPIGQAGGVSTYGYVSGNPLMYSDPMGLVGVGMQFGPNYSNTPSSYVPTTHPLLVIRYKPGDTTIKPIPGLHGNIQCLQLCLSMPLTITGGGEGAPYHKGKSHPGGTACDFGCNSNPRLCKLPNDDVRDCAAKCGFTNGFRHAPDHWHLSTSGIDPRVPLLPVYSPPALNPYVPLTQPRRGLPSLPPPFFD
jgi:RHS repeat-associated protein